MKEKMTDKRFKKNSMREGEILRKSQKQRERERMYETARERRVMPESAVFARTAGFVNVSLKIFKSRTWSLRHVQLKNSFSIKKM